MSIPFNLVPGSIRLPGFRAELNSGERPYQGRSRQLILAPMLSTGTATAGTPIMLPADPAGALGPGSIAAEMAVYARRQAALYETWILPVADPAGTSDVAKITVNAVPAPGAYPFWVFGRRCSVFVAASDTTSTLATKIAAAANANFFLPGSNRSYAQPFVAAATAAVTGGSPAPAYVSLTARHHGPLHNVSPWIDFVLGTPVSAQVSPLAACVGVTYPTAGTGTPDMNAVLAGIGDLDVDWIVSVWDDSGSRAAIENFLLDRWNPMKQKYGLAVYARQGTSGQLATLGLSVNSPRQIEFAQNNSPDPIWVILAQCAADMAQYWDMGSALSEAQVLARPPMNRVLRDLSPPRTGINAFADDERNALYFDGIAPLIVNASGQVTFELIPTMSRVDVNGLDDTNFLWVNYPLIYIYYARFMRNFAWQRHVNTSLVGDQEPRRAGQTRPKDLVDTFVLGYTKLRNEAGIVEDIDGFIKRLQVERSSDPTRANVLAAIDAANPFHVLAVNIQASAQFQS